MSQDGWMIGINTNSETYSDETYFGFKNRLGVGEVNYTSAGTGTMTGIPDYQFETTGYFGIPMERSNSRTTIFSGLGFSGAPARSRTADLLITNQQAKTIYIH